MPEGWCPAHGQPLPQRVDGAGVLAGKAVSVRRWGGVPVPPCYAESRSLLCPGGKGGQARGPDAVGVRRTWEQTGWASSVNPPSPVSPTLSLSLQQFGKILDVEIIFNERGSKVGAAQRPPPLPRRL